MTSINRSTKWRQENPDRAHELAKRYYDKNREVIIQRNKNWLDARPEYKLWHAARSRSKRKGMEFNIEVSDIVIPELCPYLNVPMDSPSLDRIDNNLGYVKGNVEVISLKANRMKNNASLKELISFSKRILHVYG
jgi:hypothetical protein